MRKDLEKKFAALPTLKEVGLALLQFALKLQGHDQVHQDVLGVHHLDFVSFNFPKGEDKFNLFVRDVDIQSVKIQEYGFSLLPLHIPAGAADGQAVCEVTHAGQLGQAAKYVWIAHNCHLIKRHADAGQNGGAEPDRLKRANLAVSGE